MSFIPHCGQLIGPAVLGAVHLNDAGVEGVGDGRHARHLEWAGGHDYLLGEALAVAVGLDRVPAAVSGAADRAHPRVELDRQLERARVIR